MTAKLGRLDFRVADEQKQLIESAATLLGESVSSFAVSTLVERANDVVNRYQNTELTRRDAIRFLEIIDSDALPNETLKKAFTKHRKKYG